MQQQKVNQPRRIQPLFCNNNKTERERERGGNGGVRGEKRL